MTRHLEHHGLTAKKKQPPEYQIWSQIKQRCFNENHPKYKNYGGRRITMDPRWRDSFSAFLEDVGPRPGPDHTIDRVDNDKGYFPSNVRWATRKEQARNTRVNRIVRFEGKDYVLAEFAEKVCMDRKLLQQRLESGLSVEEAISRPVEGGNLYITWKWETHSLATWAQKLKINYMTLYSRIFKMKWPLEKAFETGHKGR